MAAHHSFCYLVCPYVRESEKAILESLTWLGLDWDEGPRVALSDARVIGGGPHGPYFQMQRLETYQKHAEDLIARGKAYRCDCSKEELDRLRKQAEKEKRHFKYPGTCRNKNLPKGTPGAVVRFRMPEEGSTTFKDLVKGEITTPHKEFQDEVILRADGVPLYNFGAVVDDIEMEITMVARGDDHVVNTPRQILMYQALEYPVPVFAHLPMILGPDKQRLSKRPGALVNYLARLGWSHGDQEIFTVPELIEKFDWEHVGATAGVFNPEKLAWLNQQWIKMTPPAELAKACGVPSRFVALMQERARTLNEIRDAYRAYIEPQMPEYDEKAVKKQLTAETKPLLAEARDLIGRTFDQGPQAMEHAFRELAEKKGLGLGKLAQPVRTAVTGTTVSPPLFETIALLGKEKALRRIDAALEKIK